MTDEERRRAERVKVALRVRYRVDGGRERFGTIENISRTGMLLVVGEQIPEQARVSVEVPGSEGVWETLVGEVVRSAAMGGFGIAFVHVDETALAFIRGSLRAP
jgi:hypothetical protein